MENNDLIIAQLISKFPIGDIPLNRKELLSKAEIVSFLSQFQEQFMGCDDVYNVVRDFVKDKLHVTDNEKFPNLNEATATLKLSNGFVQDYDKIQYLKESNSDFERVFDEISGQLFTNSRKIVR